MGIPPNGVGGGDLGRTGGGAVGGERSTEKEVNRGRAERVGVEVVKRSMD